MLWPDTYDALPSIKYCDMEIYSKPRKIFECYVQRDKIGAPPKQIMGFVLLEASKPRFIACMSDNDGTYFLEIVEPDYWRYAEVSD